MTQVLFIVPDFYPNSTGFANASLNLVKSIIEFGQSEYQVHVFTTIPLGKSKEWGGVKILRYENKKSVLPLNFSNLREQYKLLKEYIVEEHIDIVFFETNTFPFLQNWIVKDFKDKVFVRIHSTADTEVPVYSVRKWYKPGFYTKRVYSFMNEVPNILSTSNYYLDFIKKEFFKENPYKIWNGRSYGLLYNTAGIDKLPEVKIVHNNTFMTMGKLSENGLTQKGFIDLLRAVFLLKKQNRLPDDFCLKMVGNGVMLPYIMKYIEKLGISDHIAIIEKAAHEEVFELIQNSKAIILLSRFEGQSMFITETLALGKPIILSDNNGMHEMISDGINGRLVRTGDSLCISKVIEEFFRYSYEDLSRMCNASRDIYINKFSSKAIYQQFDEAIKLKY